jgi:hypothetical protein
VNRIGGQLAPCQTGTRFVRIANRRRTGKLSPRLEPWVTGHYREGVHICQWPALLPAMSTKIIGWSSRLIHFLVVADLQSTRW